MSVTTTNLIQGPATIYAAAFGAVEPSDAVVAPGVAWADLGATREGVSLNIETEWADLTVDQIIEVVERRATGRTTSVATQLAEVTLENLARAINTAAPVGGVLEPGAGIEAFVPTYSAIMFDGFAPGGKRRRVIVRKVLNTEAVALANSKTDQQVIPVSFAAHYVSASIKPWRIEDEPAV